MLYFDRNDVSEGIELVLLKQVHQKSVIFFNVDIF